MNTLFKEKKSVMSDIFFGDNSSIIESLNYNFIKYNYEPYFFLNFVLEEVRIFIYNYLK